MVERSTPASAGYVIQTQFDVDGSGSSVLSSTAALAAPGEYVNLLRDQRRQVTVQLRKAEGELKLILLDWKADFCVAVNAMTYHNGPIELFHGDIIQLCEPNTYSDTHSYLVSQGLPVPCPSPASGHPSAQMASPFDLDPLFVEECSKWQNFYSYRYSTTNTALVGDPPTHSAWRRYIGLRPEEGCPGLLVHTHISSSDVFPRPTVLLPEHMNEDFSARLSRGPIGFRCRDHCELLRHGDVTSIHNAHKNAADFLRELRRETGLSGSKVLDSCEGDPWKAFEEERLRSMPASMKPKVSSSGVGDSSTRGVGQGAEVWKRIERLERLMAGTAAV